MDLRVKRDLVIIYQFFSNILSICPFSLVKILASSTLCPGFLVRA